MTEAVAGPMMTGAGSAGNFLVGMGNFVYQIAKDAGATMSFEQATAEGVSNADTAFEIDPASYRRYSLQGIWYTHTRAWASTVHRLHSHTRTANPKKLKSSYLCTICPLEITYETGRPNVAKFQAEFAEAEVAQAQKKLALHKEVLAELPEYTKAVTRPKRPHRPKAPVDPGADADREAKREYRAALAKHKQRMKEYDEKKERYDIEKSGYELEKSTRVALKQLIEEKKSTQLAAIAAQQKVLDKRKRFLDVLERSGNSVTYMQNFTIRCTTTSAAGTASPGRTSRSRRSSRSSPSRIPPSRACPC